MKLILILSSYHYLVIQNLTKYGENEAFQRHSFAHPSSWQTIFREATLNHLIIDIQTGGKLKQSYPVIIELTNSTVEVVRFLSDLF